MERGTHIEVVEEPRHARTQKGSPKRRVFDFGGSGRLNTLERNIDDGIGGVQQADERDERGDRGGKEDSLQNGHCGRRKGPQKHVKEHWAQQLVMTSEVGDYPAAALKQQENRPRGGRFGRVWE